MKLLLGLIFATIFLSGCSKNEINEFNYFYFDTPISVSIYDKASSETDFKKAENEINLLLVKFENLFSQNISDSLINKLNSNDVTKVDQYLLDALNNSIKYCKLTNGVYDPTAGKLIELWSINENDIVPNESSINQVINDIDCTKIYIENDLVKLNSNTSINLGSVVKGLASDEIGKILKNNNVENAIINLGGNVATLGRKTSNQKFQVGIADPRYEELGGTNEPVISFEIENQSLITSGVYERFFLKDDIYYHHILNANTGQPQRNGLSSVSIISDSGIDADSLSTAAFLLGKDEGMKLIKQLKLKAVFITEQNEIFLSEKMDYKLLNDEFEVIVYE